MEGKWKEEMPNRLITHQGRRHSVLDLIAGNVRVSSVESVHGAVVFQSTTPGWLDEVCGVVGFLSCC